MRFIIIFVLTAYVSVSLGLENNPNCGDDYVLIAEEHDQVVPECDQFGCPEVESCDTCKEVCDGDDSCAAFECNEFEERYSCSFNGHLEHTDECGPLCQSQTVCVKNSTEIDGSHFVEPESQNRRKLWPLSSGPYTPGCNPGYKDRTNGNSYWWACGVNCAGGKYWTDYLCNCACEAKYQAGQYVVSGMNDACPSGSSLINDQTECFGAYNLLKYSQGWTSCTTGCEISGTWGHVSQCGVHMSFDASGHGGNHKVHFKTNHVDGSSPGERWVHICKRTGSSVCPTASQNGRCGPLYNHQVCSTFYHGWALYCNEANGWCGNLGAHRDAQSSTQYDDSQLVGACRPGGDSEPCQATVWGDHQYRYNPYNFHNDIPDLARTAFGQDGVSSAYVQGSCDLVCYSSLDYYGISLVLKPGWHNMVSSSFPGKNPFYSHDFTMWNDRIRSCRFVSRNKYASNSRWENIGRGSCLRASTTPAYVSGYSWIGPTTNDADPRWSASTSKYNRCREVCEKDPQCTGYQQSGSQQLQGGTANCVIYNVPITGTQDLGDGWQYSNCYRRVSDRRELASDDGHRKI